jgi:hypothetical protein
MKQYYKQCQVCNESAWISFSSLTAKDKRSTKYTCKKCKEHTKGKTMNHKRYFTNQELVKMQEIESSFPGGVTCQPGAGAGADHWDSELETLSDCSKAPAKIKVWVTPLAKVKIDALMEQYPNIEWFAYLLGNGEDKFTVTDIHVPKQTITATSVDEIECEEFNDLPIIGAIHSHHGMGTGFSGTDHAFVNQNHNISLVISKASIAGQVRWSTPCGCLKIVDAVVKPKIEVDFDKKAFLAQAVPNIKKKTATVTTRVVTNYVGNAGIGPGRWVNGVWVPANRTLAQTQYINGKSVKEIAQETAKEKEEKGETEEQENVTKTNTDDGDGLWGVEQSLMEALDDAFPEAKTA